MPGVRTIEKKARKLKAKAKAYRVSDKGQGKIPGLRVTVQASGRRSYEVTWRLRKGAPRQSMTLGVVGIMTLEEAREAASAAIRLAQKGIDPRKGSTDQRTFGQLLDEWRDYMRDTKARVSADETRAVVKHSCKAWLERVAVSITRTEIEDLLRAKRDSGTKSAANRLCSHLKTMFRWAHRRQGPMLKHPGKCRRRSHVATCLGSSVRRPTK